MPSVAVPKVPVIGAKPGTSVEVAPGKSYAPLTLADVDPIAVVEIVPAGGGTFRFVARVCPRTFGCTAKNLRRLGIGISTSSMIRLIEAGFVVGGKTTPNLYQFDPVSYWEHDRASKDPEFWDKVEPHQPGGARLTNRERFRQAL